MGKVVHFWDAGQKSTVNGYQWVDLGLRVLDTATGLLAST